MGYLILAVFVSVMMKSLGVPWLASMEALILFAPTHYLMKRKGDMVSTWITLIMVTAITSDTIATRNVTHDWFLLALLFLFFVLVGFPVASICVGTS